MKTSATIIALLLTLGLSANVSASSERIGNGGFDNSPNMVDWTWSSVDLVGGWGLSSTNAVDMNGTVNAGNNGAGSVSQDFTTVQGESYDVSFWISANAAHHTTLGCADSTKTLTTTVDGVTRQDSVTTSGTVNPPFVQVTFSFTASGGSATLTLTGDASEASCGPIVDSVSVIGPNPDTQIVDAAEAGIDFVLNDTLRIPNCVSCHNSVQAIRAAAFLETSPELTMTTTRLDLMNDLIDQVHIQQRNGGAADGAIFHPTATSPNHPHTTSAWSLYALSAVLPPPDGQSNFDSARFVRGADYLRREQSSTGFITHDHALSPVDIPNNIQATAQSAVAWKRALQLTGDPGGLFKDALDLAEVALRASVPGTATGEYVQTIVWMIIGLSANDVPDADPKIVDLVSKLKAVQNTNGGWSVLTNGPTPSTGTDGLATGIALCGLQEAGEKDSSEFADGVQHLLDTQLSDGSWPSLPIGISQRPRVSATIWPTLCLAQTQVADEDEDTVPDASDNCPEIANSDQTDTDGDGAGDACDDDDDNDNILDGDDNCPVNANSGQEDLDQDGLGNVCDDDADDDGFGEGDNCPLTPQDDQLDTDNDGAGDACDDDDGDGLPDETDPCPLDATNSCNTAPVANCADVTVSTELGVCHADASVDDDSSDPDGDLIILEQDPDGPYPLGGTLVTLNVTDIPQNGTALSDSCMGSVTVEDNEAPSVVCNVPDGLNLSGSDLPASFTATGDDACIAVDVSVAFVGCTRDGSPTGCSASASGATLTISELGNNKTAHWTATAVDASDNSTTIDCEASRSGGGSQGNQGVGNGPEGSDPGNSNQGDDANSNDENGGTPGNPGKKGGKK